MCIKRALLFDSPVWTRDFSGRIYYIPSDDLQLPNPFSAFLLFLLSCSLSLRLYSLNRILHSLSSTVSVVGKEGGGFREGKGLLWDLGIGGQVADSKAGLRMEIAISGFIEQYAVWSV